MNTTDIERIYCLITENMTDVIWTVNVDSPTRANYISPSIKRLLGYTVEEAMSKKMEEIFTYDSFKKAMTIFTDEMAIEQQDHINKHRSRMLEFELRHKNGSLVAVEINYNFIRGDNGRPVEILAVARDITKRKETEAKLREHEEQLREAQSLGKIANYTISGPNFDITWSDEMYKLFERETNLPPPSIDEIRNYFTPEEFAKFMTLTRTVIAEGNEVHQDIIAKLSSGNTPVFHISIRPLEGNDGKIIGIFGTIQDITERKHAEDQIKLAYEKLRQSFDGVTKLIAATVEMRDPYTAGHQIRVAHLAQLIANEMNLTPEQAEQIRTAALVHDIGKICIPAEILSKPSKLNSLEFSLIKTHCQVGYDVIKNFEFPYPVARWVLEHHERINGSGYPNALSGDQISLEARILAVADVVEAMSSHRPYRPSVGIALALEEILKNKDVLYDGKAVDACIKLFYEKGFKFE